MENDLVGIYMILCVSTGKFYVGQSQHIKKRWREHKRLLTKKSHSNQHLQRLYKKYGASDFVFAIILECEKVALEAREQQILDHFKRDNRCVNICWFSGTTRGIKHKESTKQLFSEQRKGEKNSMFGKPRTDAVKAKLRAANLGKKYSPEVCKKMSLSRTGIKNGPMSDERKLKLSVTKTGKPNIKLRKIKPEDHQKVSDLYHAGQSAYDIARLYLCDVGVVYRILRGIGIKIRNSSDSTGMKRNTDYDGILDDYRSGVSLIKIAEKFSIYL